VPFEDLPVMPGDVNDVHRRLAWPRDQQRLADRLIGGTAPVRAAEHVDALRQSGYLTRLN
jgi:hypothetical protein